MRTTTKICWRWTVLFNQGEGLFEQSPLLGDDDMGYLSALGTDVALADLDGDDDLDVLITLGQTEACP